MALPFDVNFSPVRLPTSAQPPDPLVSGVGTPRTSAMLSGLQNLKRGQTPKPTASVYFSPTKRQFLIGGKMVDERNEAGVLEASKSMTGAPTASPGADFQAVDPTSFGAYVDRIANPDLGRRFSKNFESASAGMGELAGAGLRFLGAEDVGKSIQGAGAQRRAELSPYEMGLEDIDGSRNQGVLDWFVGVVGQFGPSVVESAVTAAIGAGVGALAGGGPNPFSAAGGALAALSGKEAVKQATLAAAKKHLAGEALEASERKLLTEQASLFAAAAEKNPGFLDNVIYGNQTAQQFGEQAVKTGGADALRRGRTQSIIGGAASFSAANSYGMGVSDIYREGLDSGSPDRGMAALGGIPYAALDLLPEFLLARRVLGDVGANAASKLSNIASTRGKALELLKRGGKGGAIGAALEGGTEAGQEALLIAANPLVDWNSPDGISRLLNSFAAGAAIGGPLGSLANLKDNKNPVNLLKPTESVGIDRPDAPDTATGTAVQPLAPTGYGGSGVNASTVTTPDNGFENISGEPVTGVPGPVPYGEYSEQQALPAPEEQFLPSGPNLLEGSQPQLMAPMSPEVQQPDVTRMPANAPGQAFLQMGRVPSSQPGRAFGRAPMEPLPRPTIGPDGQYEMFPPAFQQAPVQPAIEETLGAAQPMEQGDLFDQKPVPAGKAKLTKKAAAKKADPLKQRTVVSQTTTRSLIDGQITSVKLSDGTTRRIQKMAGRGDLVGWYDLDDPTVYLGNTKAEAIQSILDEDPDPPPKPKGTKGAALKKPVKTSTNIKVVAPLKAKPATKLEREMEVYLADVDDADSGKKSAREAIEFYANSTEADDVSPEVRKAAQDYLRDTTVAEEKKVAQATNKVTSLGKLTAFLDSILADLAALNDTTKRVVAQARMKVLYKEAVAVTPGGVHAVRGAKYNGRAIEEYIASDGQLKIEKIEQDDGDPVYVLAAAADSPLGQFKRADTDADITSTIPHGRVKMFVKDFASRLNVKPKAHVFRNVSDLKASDPDLFKRAKAARKQGDFETTDAVGYSFGDTIIIFSDYVRTEQQLRFVLAHEAIGHFGLRSILTKEELSRALNAVYNADHRVRILVDRMAEARGISREEAIEEWLADFAAEIDTSLIKRIWVAIKNALSRLGIKFEDDMARLLVAQSRRYVRDGIPGSFFSVKTLHQHMMALQQNSDEGRFATNDWRQADLGTTWVNSSAISHPVMRGIKDVPSFLSGRGGNLKDLSRKALELLQTLDNKATRSEGLRKIYEIFQAQSRQANAFLSDYNEKLAQFTHNMKTKTADKLLAGEYLNWAAMVRGAAADEALIDSFDRIVVTNKDGDPEIDQAVLDAVKKAGFVTAEEFRAGVTFEDSAGNKQTKTFPIDETSRAWEIYVEQREVIAQAAVDLMLANFRSVAERYEVAASRFKTFARNPFSRQDRQAAEKIIDTYREIRKRGSTVEGSKLILSAESEKAADDFLIKVTMAFDRSDILKQWEGADAAKDAGPASTVPDEMKEAHKDLVPAIQRLHAAGYGQADRFKIQQLIRNFAVDEVSAIDAERYAKKTILGSYVPFKRRGEFQMAVAAYNSKGQLVRLSEDIRGALYYGRTDDKAYAENIANELEKIYGGKTWKLTDVDGNAVEVTLKAQFATAAQTANDFNDLNYNAVLRVFELTGQALTPDSRKRLITLMEDQNSRSRSNLMRKVAPGWDKDVIRATSEWLETTAHVAAKKLHQHRLDEVLDTDRLWRGDDDKLRSLKSAMDGETDPHRKARARREYDSYAYMYQHMKDAPNTVMINGKERPTFGLGERYREEARSLLRWYEGQSNIIDNPEDILSGEIGSRLKTAVVFSQLGGTVATAAINTVSLLTHTIPFLSFYNANTGIGGGFSAASAVAAVMRSANTMKDHKLGEIAYLHKILEDGTYTKYGLTEDEIKFLVDQTRKGPLQAVLPDALLGSARGKITHPLAQQAAKGWMWMFSYTEKLNRRVTALAAYRLEKERATAEGLSNRAAIDSAIAMALEAVDKTQGEYAQFNRPKLGRGNITSYIFMYKQFPIITIQLLRHMPLKGKLAMLGMMLLLAGVKGLPFADDIMDLIDTILQKLGIKIGSVEAEMYRTLDAFVPGLGNPAMRGLLDGWTGGTFSTRFSTGDLLPLTGMLKAGADPWRETTNLLGPMFGGLFGFASSIGGVGSLAVDTLGGRPSSESLLGLLRSSPVALGRALGDTLAYADSNAITNQYGRVVSPGVDPMTLIFRVLGVYPAAATRANDYIRIGKQTRDYMLEVSKGFKDSYIKAATANGGRGDTARMRQIVDEVKNWNDAAEGTGLEIANFETSVKKALKEAKRPAGERFLKTTPLGMRDQVEELMSIYGAQ